MTFKVTDVRPALEKCNFIGNNKTRNKTFLLFCLYIVVLQLNNGSMSESEVKEDDDHETTGSMNNKDENMLCDKENIRRKKKKKRKKSGKVLSSHTRSSEDNVEVS